MTLLKCCTQCTVNLENSGHRMGKDQSLSQFQRRAVLKNVQATGQLHSSPMLVRLCPKLPKLGFSIMWTKNFQMFQLGLEKAEEPEFKFRTFSRSQRKQGDSRKTSTSVSLTMSKPLSMWIIINVKWNESHSVISDVLWPHGLYSPWNSPGQNTGVVAFPFSRGSSQPRDWTEVFHIAGGFLTSLATMEACGKLLKRWEYQTI